MNKELIKKYKKEFDYFISQNQNQVRLTKQQPVSVQLFYKLATEHNIDFKKVHKFLIRLEKLRRILK